MDEEDFEDCVVMLNACVMLNSVWKSRRKRRFRSIGVDPLWQRRRQQGDGYNLVQELRLNEKMFFKYTRLNYARFDYLLSLCAPLITKRKMSTTIPPVQRLAMTLRFMATGDDYSTLGFAYRCGLTTVSVIVKETLAAIVHVLHRLAICEPRSQTAWRGVSQRFYQRWNLPHCLGAIDGRHMVIRAPKANGSQFFNYHKTHSMVLLAVADADYSFIMVDVGAEGSLNDAAILNNSTFWKRVKAEKMHIPPPECLPNSPEEMPFFFVGDNIFQLQEHLMKPFGVRRLTVSEAIYNYRISRARRIVENAFGILVARWRVFRAPITLALETAENLVLAACCLHNFIIRSCEVGVEDDYLPSTLVDVELPDGTITPGRWKSMTVGDEGALVPIEPVPRRSGRQATGQRKTLMQYLNNEGAVPWQNERVNKGFWGAYVTADLHEALEARLTEEAVDCCTQEVDDEVD